MYNMYTQLMEVVHRGCTQYAACGVSTLRFICTVLPVMSHYSTNLQVAVTCQDMKQFNKRQGEQLACVYTCTVTTSLSDFFKEGNAVVTFTS